MGDERVVAGGGGADVPARVVDVLLAAGVALALAVIVAMAQGSARPPDPLAYGFAVAFGGVTLLRRRAPLTVIGLTVAGVLVYYALEYPPIGVAVPLAAALFAGADAGRTIWSVLGGAAVLALSIAFRLAEGEAAALLFGYEAVTNAALMAAAIALGEAVRARRLAAERHAAIVELLAADARRDAEDRVLAERERVSRDLHDSLGHTLSVVSLHTDVAAQAAESDDHATLQGSLSHVRAASGRALADLRLVVRLLRDPDRSAAAGAPSLAALDDLVASAEAAGLRVVSAVERPDALPAPVEAAAYRIVQEALTNVVRHAHAREAVVTLAPTGDGGLSIEVGDDGVGANAGPPRPGHGLLGMTERARLLGGHLSAGPGPDGFVVRAVLPGAGSAS